MYTILIVEDEAESADSLRSLVLRYEAEHNEHFEVVMMRSALELLECRRSFDVCFLDIGLPGINGLEAARLLRAYNTASALVFVTSLAKYAMHGYEVDACGFILKPATYTTLSMALERALRKAGLAARQAIAVPTDNDTLFLRFDQVLYADVRGHNLTYHMLDGEAITVRGSLGQLEEQLADAPALRVSRSRLVNMDLIAAVRGDCIVMVNGDKLRVPSEKKTALVQRISRHLGGRR